MSDQQNDWWNESTTPPPPPATSPPPPSGADPRSPADPPVADRSVADRSDPDATVVVPARHPGAPPVDPGHGGTPAQYAPQQPPASQPPPPRSQPPQYGGPPPRFGVGPQSSAPHYGAPNYGTPNYGAPDFVQPGGTRPKYRAPGGSITMLIGSLLAIAGTFLPWVTFPGDSVNGYERYFIGDSFDGLEWSNPGAFVAVTMVLVAIASIAVLAAGRSIATWLLGLMVSGLAGLTTIGALAAVGSVLNSDFGGDRLDVGFGIGLCVVGAIAAGVGSIIVAAKRS